MSQISVDSNAEKWKQKEFLYAVLNLPAYATEADIREKHRQLSLIFHPDKQRDARTKEVAQEKFLEVQKAYEILCDPFLRAVYDALGFEGLSVKWPEYYRSLPPNELYPAIRNRFSDMRSAFLEANTQPRGTVTCAVDARELFQDGWLASRAWFTDLSERVAATRVSAMAVRHSVRKRLGQQTTLKIISKISQASLDDDDGAPASQMSRYNTLRGNIVGIVQHQYSSKLLLEGRASLLRGRVLTLTSAYSNGPTTVSTSVILQPRLRSLLPPPVIVSFRQRLFQRTQTFGSLELTIHPAAPSVTIGLNKPAVVEASTSPSGADEFDFQPPLAESIYTGWACGLTLRLAGGGPSVFSEWAVAFSRLGAVLKAALEWSLLTGISCRLSGAWESDEEDAKDEIRAQPGSRAEADVTWSLQGVQLRLDFMHNGQQLIIPITLADERAPGLALLATVLPATTFTIFDYYALRRRRTARRNARLVAHQRAQEDQSTQKRAEAELVGSLLKDAARRNTEAEKDNDGLVILEATYFPIEDNGQSLPDLGLDVTIPLQALVQKSQLLIPAGRSKSILRGFYDPLPECRKRLSVRYTFRGRLHYVEVGDRAALVLPLESHLVEEGA